MSQPAELSPLWEARIARFNNIFCNRRGSSASQFLLGTAPNLGVGEVRSFRQDRSPRMFLGLHLKKLHSARFLKQKSTKNMLLLVVLVCTTTTIYILYVCTNTPDEVRTVKFRK